MAKNISLDLDDDLVAKLDVLARVEERSRTSLIRLLLKRSLIDAYNRLGPEDGRPGVTEPAGVGW